VIDFQWRPRSFPGNAAELITEGHEPVLKRLDQVLGSKTFDDLRLRQPVS
jgi:hypothetical protein